MTQASDHDERDQRQVRPCGIPRAMMLDIIRKRELRELREEQMFPEADPLPGTE